ncbi:metal-dependent hydrolase [Halobacteriales archaeon Cl-PHB]
MWPWEHLAVGYVGYSLLCRAFGKRPRTWPVLVLAVGTQFPDLVDKPLGWILGVLPSGQSLAHSVLVAVPVVTTLGFLGRWLGGRDAAAAFGVGYLSHLPADVVYPALIGGSLRPEVVLWPLVPASTSGTVALLDRLEHLVGRYIGYLQSSEGALYLGVEVGLLLFAFALWHVDGYPGVPRVGRRGLRDDAEGNPQQR